MKRIIAFILVFIMSFGVCAFAEGDAAESTPEAKSEPEWEIAVVRVNGSRIVWQTYDRGEEVTVIGALDDWYIIETDDADLFISRSFVRLSTEPEFEARTAYARSKAKLYSSPGLSGEEGTTLKMNTRLEVLDGKDGWLYVEYEDGSGYISPEQISDRYIDYGYYSGGGSSSGSGGGSSGVDGGDISLCSGFAAPVTLQLLGIWNGPEYEPMDEVSATVLCDGTEAYLCMFDRGDDVRVSERAEDECTLLVGELEAKLPRWQLSFADEPPYESREGFARSGAALYEDYRLEKELESLAVNDSILIIDELEEQEIYVVEYEGQTGCMRFADVSETKIYDNGGGYSGSSGNGTGAGRMEWTPPML